MTILRGDEDVEIIGLERDGGDANTQAKARGGLGRMGNWGMGRNDTPRFGAIASPYDGSVAGKIPDLARRFIRIFTEMNREFPGAIARGRAIAPTGIWVKPLGGNGLKGAPQET
ncbi:MAG: hypothetical protein Fur0042_00640 [Cyanophyceae cyanobacterium]